MPKLPGLEKVLLIGSGPIVIGQAAEFDFSGSQACRALKEEGITIVLANSNPATIQTDATMADAIYLEPLTARVLERIIEKEKPQGVIGTMAGQTGLNLTVALKKTFEKHGVKILGTGIDAIEMAEDREKFRDRMREIGEPIPQSGRARSKKEGEAMASQIGLPVMVRPDFCLGGTGSSIARNEKELEQALQKGLAASGSQSVLIEKSLEGLAEMEYEVVRDAADNCITICVMENLDPIGVHTGESIVVAPCQTLCDDDHQKLRSAAIKIIRALGVQGACNVQFALNQTNGEYWVIEVNPRASRSSALASKATGVQVAKIAAGIQTGALSLQTLNLPDELAPLACAVKAPVFPFAKFPGVDPLLGAEMKSTGETMGIGENFEQAFAKAELAAGARYGNSAVVCHCGRWKKTIVEKLSQAGIRVFAPYSSEESAMLLKEGRASFLVCGLEGSEIGREERKLSASMGLPCISSAFKALAIANMLSMLAQKQATGEELPLIELSSLQSPALTLEKIGKSTE